jgi:hypothetical protein
MTDRDVDAAFAVWAAARGITVHRAESLREAFAAGMAAGSVAPLPRRDTAWSGAVARALVPCLCGHVFMGHPMGGRCLLRDACHCEAYRPAWSLPEDAA